MCRSPFLFGTPCTFPIYDMDANIQWIQINVKKTGKTQSVLWEVTLA